MKKFFVVLALLAAMFLSVGCSKNKIGGLTWSEKSPNYMNWNEAVIYCKNLNEGGYSDWRLPNIDELRTVIKNCPKTETDGECKVSEKNGRLSSDDWHPDDSCYCEIKKNNHGYYSKLGDDDNVWLWSSSTRSDDSVSAWGVDFGSGLVDGNFKFHYYSVRCVR